VGLVSMCDWAGWEFGSVDSQYLRLDKGLGLSGVGGRVSVALERNRHDK